MFDEIAKTFFETEDEYERGLKLLREFGVAAKHSSNFTELEENFFLHVDDYDCHLLDSARELLEKREQGNGPKDAKVSQQLLSQLADLIQSRIASSVVSAPETHGLHSKPVSEAFKEFIAEKRHGWKSINGSEGQYTEQVFPLFLEINNGKDIETAKINKTHVTTFTNAVHRDGGTRSFWKLPEIRVADARISRPPRAKLESRQPSNGSSSGERALTARPN